MVSTAHGYAIYSNGVFSGIGPADGREWAHLESFIRAEYERCHPDDTFEDLKRRARFSKEDQGLLQEWMALAAKLAIGQSRIGGAEKARTNAKRNRAAA